MLLDVVREGRWSNRAWFESVVVLMIGTFVRCEQVLHGLIDVSLVQSALSTRYAIEVLVKQIRIGMGAFCSMHFRLINARRWNLPISGLRVEVGTIGIVRIRVA